GFHFQTQLSDGSIVFEEYYNQNNSGFGAYVEIPYLNMLASQSPFYGPRPFQEISGGHPWPREGYSSFGPAWMSDPQNRPWRYGRHYNGKGKWYRMPFMPGGSISLTPFSHGLEGPADVSILNNNNSPAVGKFTHPSGAPDNHLLTVY